MKFALRRKSLIRNSHYIAQSIGAKHPDTRALEVKHLLWDSRQLSTSEGALFFAIRGQNHDGHAFIAELYRKGVRLFVVEHDPQIAYADALYLKVDNSLKALQRLGAKIRQDSKAAHYAVTGSNGKTITKEWLWRLLEGPHKVFRNPKSYNSQIGVPISLWEMEDDTDIAISEAGVSQPGEMEALADILQPIGGIFTNIGSAHGENFPDLPAKVLEKLKLFKGSEFIIYPFDDLQLREVLSAEAAALKAELRPWSFQKREDCAYFEILNRKTDYCRFNFHWEGQVAEFEIPFSDDASLENVGNALYFSLSLGHDKDHLRNCLLQLAPVEMRLQMKKGREQSLIIDDAYNSDLESLRIALHFLDEHGRDRQKILVISDLLQSSFKGEALYAHVRDIVQRYDLEQIYAIGPQLKQFGLGDLRVTYYDSTEAFIQEIHHLDWRDKAVLLKGSRPFEFERIDRRLSLKHHETVLEVYLDRLVHNLNYYRSRLQEGQKLMVMVKAFAYGSGSEEVARVLQFHGVDYLAVAYADEGVALRKAGVYMPIMVLNTETEALFEMIEYNLEPEVYSLLRLKEVAAIASQINKELKIHLKLETGMHRLGFEATDVEEMIEILKANPNLKVVSAFSHLAASDDPQERDFTLGQIRTLSEVSNKIEDSLGYTFLRHIANTGAIEDYPEAYFDMVRLGIGLYGVASHPEEQKKLRLVSELKATVSQVKRVKAGDTVGYGRTWVAPNDTRIAVVSIGYADGFPRSLSNGKGQVLIRGVLYSVVGRVCMDMIMVEVKDAPVTEGDEVLIFGLDLPIQKMAAAMGTIPYEVLTGISSRVKRLYFMS